MKAKEIWIAQNPFCSEHVIAKWYEPAYGETFDKGNEDQYVEFKKYVLIEVEEG